MGFKFKSKLEVNETIEKQPKDNKMLKFFPSSREEWGHCQSCMWSPGQVQLEAGGQE